MGLSFEDSLNATKIAEEVELNSFLAAAAINNNSNNMIATADIATADIPVAASDGVAAYSGGVRPENSNRYRYYEIYTRYTDANMSRVDDGKNIIIDSKQINLTQEDNSQYIPFVMPRYYDGFDLSTTFIQIYWVNESGYGSFSSVCNVYVSDTEISFGWLVDKGVTSQAGQLKFEIQAKGKTKDDRGVEDDYVWKTKPSKDLTVLQALEASTVIRPDESWSSEFLTIMHEYVDISQESAAVAQAAAVEARQIADDLMDGLEDEVQSSIQSAIGNNYYTISDIEARYSTREEINTKLSGYYTQEEMDNIVVDINKDIESTLIDYATTEYVDDAIANADLDKYATVEYVGDIPTDENGNLVSETVVDYVDYKVSTVDVTEQLEGFATKEYVSEVIAAEDITSKLGNYYTKEQTYSKTEIDNALDNVEVDLTGYVTETKLNERLNDYVANETYNDAVSGINEDIVAIKDILDGIDKSPRASYVTTYNEKYELEGVEYTGENTLVLYEVYNKDTDHETRSVVAAHTISGGSGGGSSNTLKVDRTTSANTAFTVDDEVVIEFTFTAEDDNGADLGQGYATWKLGSKTIVNKEPLSTGFHSVNLTQYFTTGNDQKLTLIVTDDIGTMRQISWYVSIVDVRLESSFIDSKVYSIGQNVGFTYTPYGGVDKTIHFILDGDVDNEVTQTSSKNAAGKQTTYTVPAQPHGSHLLEVYMTANINGKDIESNHITKDILWYDSEISTPIIGCATPVIDMVQYNSVNIKYSVFDPSNETPEVTWYIDGEIASVETLTEKDRYGYYTYSYKANDCGTFILTVVCGDSGYKNITINVEELDIDVSPVVDGLEFDFNPVGYSNSSADRLWSYNDISMTVSDNFDWINGGYQIDDNGDKYFCVKAGTNAVIDYNLFADDPKGSGKEFKVIFRTKNIRKRDTSFLTCMDSGIGLDMKVENATVYNNTGSLRSDYCEDTIIEYEFNINKSTDMMIVMSYEDGTPSKPYEYTETTSFKQSTAQPITIGSEDCDIHIYRMKAYSNSLTDENILDNFIADARNADEMIARYNRNQIYNDDNSLISTSASGDFSAEALMKAAPNLRYIFIEVPQFTNDKDNKIDGCTVYFRYPAGTRPQDNWTCTGVRHRGQGTSSNLYGYAGRNIDLCMDRDESLFTWEDEDGNMVESSTITLTDTSVPTDYLNIKVNIASSENANNANMARRFNEYQPFLRYARKKDSKVKDTMEFYNCVVFVRETSEDADVPHREFNDTNWHFYSIGNVGDSKKTDDTRVNNKRDPREHVVEIMDADVALAGFPTGKDGNAVCTIDEWCEGNSVYDILYSTEYVYDDEDGSFKSFANESYEFRYEMKNLTAEQREVNINAWRDLYKFIATSTDEEFYAHLKDYFVVDSALYFYLFTERYTMVDNRAKNSFWHYGKVYISSTEASTLGATEASYYIVDDEAAAINDGYRYDLTFGYDFDKHMSK